MNFVDPDGKKLRVPKEYQQPFLMDMKLAFGNKVELFSFDDAGILSIEARNQKFTSGLTSEQKKLFKGLTKVVRSKNITSVVYADEYELTIDVMFLDLTTLVRPLNSFFCSDVKPLVNF